jgi:hypothetical protein
MGPIRFQTFIRKLPNKYDVSNQMSYAEANKMIQNHVAENGGAKANPMIVYALDSQFFPDDLYQELCDDREGNRLPIEYPWLIGLFWIRRFYEFGSGNDHLQCLGNGANIDEVKTRIGNVWKLANPISRDSLIFHCPILKAADAGGVSQVTNGMKFLLKSLRPDFSLGEFYAAIERLESKANTSKGQIKAAECYEKHFVNILRTLQSGNGIGWLAEFNEHPLRLEAVQCEWGLLVNGGIRTIALRVVGRDTVKIQQGEKLYEKGAYRSYAIFTWDELKKAGINPEKAILAAGHKVAPADFEQVRLLRVSRRDHFHQFVATETDEIQAADLWVLTNDRESNPFKLGESPLATLPSRLTESPELYLHKLKLGDLDRSIPKPLSFKGQILVKIGAAPSLLPLSGESEFQFHLDPETWLVFGEETKLELRDFYGIPTNLRWSPNVECRDTGIFLSKKVGETKTTATVLLPERGYRLRVSVVFLPEEMRGSMLSENTYDQDGISWHPQTDFDTLRPRVKGAGLCPGLLTQAGEEPVQVSVPSENVHFWIREGLYTNLCFDTPLIGEKEILQQQLTVECYLPPGLNTVIWGDCIWFTSEEAGYYSLNLNERPTSAVPIAALGLRVKTQSGQEFEILKVKESPTVTVKNEICSIIFHETFRAEDWDYCLVSEGALGGSMGELVASGSCADLNCECHESVARRLLDVEQFHTDEGCSLVLGARGSHRITENPQAFFSKYPERKPTDDFYGPYVIQESNPLRTQESFSQELKGRKSTPILLPVWIRPSWGQKANIQTRSSAGFPEDFLKTDFTQGGLDSILSNALGTGENWLAHKSWGGSMLPDLLEKITSRHQYTKEGGIKPFSWRKMTSCIFLAGLSEITKGKKPDKVWLPLECVGLEHRLLGHGHHTLVQLSNTKCLLNDAPQNPRFLRFLYGGQVQLRYSDSNEFRPLSWEAVTAPTDQPSTPDWWPENGIGDFVGTPPWSAGWKALNSIYYQHIKEAGAALGRGEKGSLAHLFRRLIGWMKISGCSKERRMIFQAAALCRIHSWMGNNFGDERSKEILSVFVSQLWQDSATQKILTNDVLTVDWMLAWLHEPEFN